jgi:hypothetical protein
MAYYTQLIVQPLENYHGEISRSTQCQLSCALGSLIYHWDSRDSIKGTPTYGFVFICC